MQSAFVKLKIRRTRRKHRAARACHAGCETMLLEKGQCLRHLRLNQLADALKIIAAKAVRTLSKVCDYSMWRIALQA